MSPEEITRQKEVEFYAASVSAWFNTSLEHDKSVFSLAAGGIGLLVTLLTTIGPSSALVLGLYVCAITTFLVALAAILFVFRHNRIYLENILAGHSTGNNPLLAKADAVALWSFGFGVVFTAIIGIATAFDSYKSKEKTMANESTKTIQTQTVRLRESFNGATNLHPDMEVRSFNGAGKLQPQAQSGANNSNAVPASASGSAAQSPAQATEGKEQK